jgi:hypothetical protein
LKASRLDTDVTWTLSPVDGGGIHVGIVQDGFVLPDNRIDYEPMNPGWGRVLDGIGRAIAQTARGARQTRNALGGDYAQSKMPQRDDGSIRSHRG